MQLKRVFANLLIPLICLSSSSAWSQDELDSTNEIVQASEDEPSGEDEPANKLDTDSFENVQGSMRSQLPFPAMAFGIGMYYRKDKQHALFNSATEFLDGGTFETKEFGLNPSARVTIIPGKLGLNADIQMGILFDGDTRKSFVFESFALGGQFTFINNSPFVASAGLGMRFINQSYSDVFSMDIFHIRPYVTGGPVFDLKIISIGILPYFGIPMFFDTNDKNNPDFYDSKIPTSPGSQGGPVMIGYSGKSAPHFSADTYLLNNSWDNEKKNPALPLNRRQNYFLDESPGGVDYGLPLIVDFSFGLFAIAEIYGTAWIWPETDSWNYAGPTIGWSFGMASISASFIFPLDHKDIQDDWIFAFGGGVSF